MLIQFTNATGKTASFAYEAATPTEYKFMLDSFDGSNAPVNSIKHTGYNQNGSTYIKSLLGTRTLKLNFWVYNDESYTQLNYLASLFSPVLGLGTLKVTTSRTRYIDCFVSQNITESGSQGKLKHYTVSLEAPVPFFYAETKNIIFSNVEYPGPSFPLEFNSYIAFDFNGLLQTVNNEGDAPCPVKFSITNSIVSNPSMICVDTDEHIGIIGNTKVTDKLVIDTTYGHKIITLNGKNITNKIDPTSTWVELPVGRSLWKFETPTQNPVLTMSWTEYYNGF